ncbi:cell wall-binding repeat-containing protein [Microbacterium ureisolvens]|uniref:Cell wall-binding repeat-containing protein n=1 Tax=Microbacterium ureisolvens TaxID=2781186 RepID=A0ABS7I5E4_9MICO|nr:cell wall-binding repeat-containing protein [Microbacterium ureisolvens]MBW9111875.1 cell wall-binding repeat-containing protein [Microbacterium ureisolvens]
MASATSGSAPSAVGAAIQPAADLSKFQPGNIVSDVVFFHKDSMSEAQIQAFLEQKVPRCQSGYTCLRDWYDTSRTTGADAMCGAYSGGVRERASRIIYKVAQACGINPQVILVMLQKEQGLVTHVWPSDWRYTIAMGQGCPDTAACDTRYYGFFNQVYGAAWQLKRYANPPGTSQYFTWYAPGKTWNVRWHPNAACGSGAVYIQNQATANLYYYTPYQPNAAALRAGYGEGDACSSYGNRNFYQYFTDWFGSTQTPANACAQPASVTPADGEFVVTVASLNARLAPTTACDPPAGSLSQGSVVTRTGTAGDWSRIRIDGATFWVSSQYLSPAPVAAYSSTRLSGVNRYDTAVAVSKTAYPAGTRKVYIASGTEFPDALAAGAAAAKTGASLLLTERDLVPGSVLAEMQRLAPTSVVILGGPDRISQAAQTSIAAAVPAATVTRIAGGDRYETSRLIAAEAFPQATAAYIVTGTRYQDAVAAAALGGAVGAPVILVQGSDATLDSGTAATLRARGVKSVTVAGDGSAVSAGIEAGLQAAGITVTRIGGANRYATSLLLNQAVYPTGAPTVYIATGTDFPDALSGSVLAAITKSPLVTTPGNCLSGPAKSWFIANNVQRITLVGGEPTLNADVARSTRC